ncbi:MAG: MarR family winged helix-turn-helix transcriptional regulator [Paenirhodobacter sp.]
MILFHVLTSPEYGVSAHDLREELGLTTSTMSRNVGILSNRHYRRAADGKPMAGYGLIYSTPDPNNAKYQLLTPASPAGEELAALLARVLKRDRDGATTRKGVADRLNDG